MSAASRSCSIDEDTRLRQPKSARDYRGPQPTLRYDDLTEGSHRSLERPVSRGFEIGKSIGDKGHTALLVSESREFGVPAARMW